MPAADDAVALTRELEDVVRRHGFQVQSHRRDWTTYTDHFGRGRPTTDRVSLALEAFRDNGPQEEVA
jgi:hypothetical protein